MSNGFFLSPEYDIASFQNGKLLLKNISNASKTLPATDNSKVYNKSDKAFVSTVKDFITTRNLGSNTDDDELTNKYYVKYFQITNSSGGKRTRRKMRKTRRRRKTRYSKNKK
jgi:hypothetical protein